VPRWLWVALAVALIAGGYVIVRHRSASQTPVAVVDRAAMIRRAAAMLHADPSIADAVYNAAADQWQVTPAEPGADPRAFGRYVCYQLARTSAGGSSASVRVIDGTALLANDYDYNAASRGIVRCGSGA
jgi:hypothetical protein